MVDFGVFAIAVAITAIGSYAIGHHACNEKWKGGLEDRVNDLVMEKIQTVSDMYQETYRNVFQDLLSIKKELEEEKKK